ncbi:MAG: hypothetical protein ACXU8N_09090 [Telluria sp.]
MSQPIQALIASSVTAVLREEYPARYASLCHAHAIVGANLISIVFNRVYRPVAGMAIVDCGSGKFIELLDNAAFARPEGGAYHCWIESADPSFTHCEVVDFTFGHNHVYAAQQGIRWTAALPPAYLWGPREQVVVKGEPGKLPRSFKPGTIWLRETDEGFNFIMGQAAQNMSAYVTLTARALQHLQAQLPAGSTLLEPLLAAPEPTGSARASVPVQA